jgi:poly-gamma-glutamate synthase PgsB/CapB
VDGLREACRIRLMAPFLVCLFVLLLLGAAERVARDRAWRDIPIRIHVNGTRGKSTVTRLIWSALAEGGITTLAKTTGTAARVLLPDGREEPVRRRGPANVREQLAFLRRARRLRARAVVVECMALDPALQAATEHEMIRATIGVITNVRLDHAEVMGDDLTGIARALANTTPRRGVLVTGSARMMPLFRARADALHTRLVVASTPGEKTPGGDSWMAENVAVALAVTRELGIDDEVALRGFARAPADPGSVACGVLDLPDGRATWTDATAANDPESLSLLLADGDDRPGGAATCASVPAEAPRDRLTRASVPAEAPRDPLTRASLPAEAPRDHVKRRRVLIYNHRDDRVPRLAAFAGHSAEFVAAERLVVTGARPPWTVRRQLARLARQNPVELVSGHRLASWIRTEAAGAAVVFCGNTRGLDVPRLLGEAASRD